MGCEDKILDTYDTIYKWEMELERDIRDLNKKLRLMKKILQKNEKSCD